MKPNALLPQILIALLLTGLAAINSTLFLQIFDHTTGIRLNLSLIALIYLVIINRQNSVAAGRVTLMAGDIMVVISCLLMETRVATLLWLYPAMIWVNRSLLRYGGILAISADLILCLLGVGAVLWAIGNGYGVTMGLWCFLLLQALHVLIPCRNGVMKSRNSLDKDNFNRALQSAENALQQLMKKA